MRRNAICVIAEEDERLVGWLTEDAEGSQRKTSYLRSITMLIDQSKCAMIYKDRVWDQDTSWRYCVGLASARTYTVQVRQQRIHNHLVGQFFVEHRTGASE